jgi:hypothetical protein
MRIYEKVRRIYQLYGVTNKLGLVIAPGIHDETPELQLAVMRWFDRYLKGEEPLVESAAKRFFPPQELKVFETLPTDSINSNIASTFVPMAAPERKPADELRAELRTKVFTGWPDENLPLATKQVFSVEHDGLRFSAFDFVSQPNISLRLYLLENATQPASTARLDVLDQAGWTNWLASMTTTFGDQLHDEVVGGSSRRHEKVEAGDGHDVAGFEKMKRDLAGGNVALAFFAPRGVGLTAWSGGETRLTKIRRRFMLLGQTMDGMRVWDIRRAVQVLHSVSSAGTSDLGLHAESGMAVNALYATLFEPTVRQLDLASLPPSHMDADAPDYLNVLKFTDIPEVQAAVAGQAKVQVQ